MDALAAKYHFDIADRHAKLRRQKAHHVVGGAAIFGGGSHTHFELGAVGLANGIFGRSGLAPGIAAGRFQSEDEAKAYVATMFPMGRWVETGDVAGAILFLASDAARYVTGTELTVDGGYSIL